MGKTDRVKPKEQQQQSKSDHTFIYVLHRAEVESIIEIQLVAIIENILAAHD